MQLRIHSNVHPMIHKERIKWFLKLQQLAKQLRNHIAPPMLASKKKLRLPEGNLKKELNIHYQNIPFINHFKNLMPVQFASTYHPNKIFIPNQKNEEKKSTSSLKKPIAKQYRIPVSIINSNIENKYQPLAKFSCEFRSRSFQARIGQLSAIQRLPPATLKEANKSTKKPFASGQNYPLSPLYINKASQEAALMTGHFRTKSVLTTRASELSKSNLEQSFINNPSVMPIQATNTAVDSVQAPINSNDSAFTLHLDGSSLGRWVTQHFERILSKPPSGITGVDPRATIPRGRVAPF